MNFRDRAVLWLATGFAVGRIPFAPGTFGALLGIPLCFGLAEIGFGATVGVLILLIFGALWIAGEAERLLGKKDAGCIESTKSSGSWLPWPGSPRTLLI